MPYNASHHCVLLMLCRQSCARICSLEECRVRVSVPAFWDLFQIMFGKSLKAVVKLSNIVGSTYCWLLNKNKEVVGENNDPSLSTWWSGCCDSNKGECDLNQSNDGSFVKRVAKNNNWNNDDRHKIHEIFLINCFVFVIILVWQTVHSSAMTQITANLMEKTL